VLAHSALETVGARDTPAASDVMIQIEGLWTRIGESVIHRDIDLQVLRGEVLAIIGDSGSGKTTLLREMLGLSQPTSGKIRLLGTDVRHLDARRRALMGKRCGVVFQDGALFSALSVFDNVAVPLREAQWPAELLEELVLLTLQKVGVDLADVNKLPAQLSGGMVKRVALARAIALEPELLLLDEPTTGLPPDQQTAIIQLIATLKQDYDLTGVLVTHDLDTLVGLADRVAVLADQRLITVGSLQEVARFPHPFVRSFFGSRSRMKPSRHPAGALSPARWLGTTKVA
jgi:phospholipid/cholesterol/gamma-HCH transport system ATP-binding protein